MLFSSSFVFAASVYLSGISAQTTDFVRFDSVGFSGSYNDITYLGTDGTCSSKPRSFSGSLGPYVEDLSVHIRGPVNLKKFAVYTTGGNSKRSLKKRHIHKKRDPDVVTVDVTETVTITDDGSTTTAAPVPVADKGANKAVALVESSDVASSYDDYAASSVISSAQSASSAPASSAPASSASSSAGGSGSDSGSATGDWSRVSYYDASSSTASNVVFMIGGLGGSPGCDGVFDMGFGNSISYANADGTLCAKNATPLKDVTIKLNKELILFLDEDCDLSCGYWRKGITAKKGWAGSYKIFAFTFKMPRDLSATGQNADLPAIWLLNGRLPRTLEYPAGKPQCSCWSSGCGELDLWEQTSASNGQLSNQLHYGKKTNGGAQGGGGSTQNFKRPTDEYVTNLAIFDGSSIYLKTVSNFDFPSSIDEDTVKSWLSGSPEVTTL